MYSRINHAAIAAIAIFSAFPALAQAVPPSIPTCFGFIDRQDEAPPVEQALFVVVDQTVGFRVPAIDAASRHVEAWMTAGREIVVFRFASNVIERNLEKVFAVRVTPRADLDWLDWLRRSIRTKFEACERQQPREARKRAAAAVEAVLLSSDRNIPRSDILASLQLVADQVRGHEAKKKVVLIVSDMLENSSILTFYSKGNVRRIKPMKELEMIARKGFLADFGGATVYVYGLGYIGGKKGDRAKTYIGPDRIQNLRTFWREYFVKSKADLGEIGAPALLREVR